MFSIEVESLGVSGDATGNSTEAAGRIVIGDFTETFRVSLGFWGESDYRRSWRQAFDVIKDDSHSRSCFMVSMSDPERTNFLTCWPAYRVGEIVYLQNSLLFLDELESGFDVGEPWASIRAHRSIDEDGNKISEWATSMDSLRDFFQ